MDGPYRAWFFRFDDAPATMGDQVTIENLVPALEAYHQRREEANQELETYLNIVCQVSDFARREGFPTTFSQYENIFSFAMSAPVGAVEEIRNRRERQNADLTMINQGWIRLPDPVVNHSANEEDSAPSYDPSLFPNQPVVGWTNEALSEEEGFETNITDVYLAECYASFEPQREGPQEPEFMVPAPPTPPQKRKEPNIKEEEGAVEK